MSAITSQEFESLHPKKYRKRPVVIDAVCVQTAWEIDTLEGVMKASPGDFIIKGVQGELYPCKPDVFLKTYDVVEE